MYLLQGYEPEPEPQSVPISRTFVEIEQASQRALESTRKLAAQLPAGEWDGALVNAPKTKR